MGYIGRVVLERIELAPLDLVEAPVEHVPDPEPVPEPAQPSEAVTAVAG